MMNRGRKRILLLFITLLMCPAYFLILHKYGGNNVQQTFAENTKEQADLAQNFFCYVYGKENIRETQITSWQEESENYLFLPSGMDLSRLRLYFSCPEGEHVVFQGKTVDEGLLVDVEKQGVYDREDECYDLLFQILYGDGSSEDYRLKVMASANIPSVYLVSDDPMEQGREWVESTPDHSNVAEAFVYEMDEDGNLICRQKAQRLRIRGNFTSSAAKKAYQFKLSSKEDLLEIGEPRKTWGLLANAYDTTLQHNTVTCHLGKELGLMDSPDCRPVDVYYDGSYMGNYLLTEIPDVSNSSVAIEKNGSYFMQIDYSHYMEREFYLELSNGMYVTLEEPEKCTDEQLEHLRELWEELVETVENGGIHPSTGKTIEDYLDIDSYARYYLVQQFAKNPDGFSSSTYCYIPQNEDKIYFCGLWDFDLCYGNDMQLKILTSPKGYYPDNAGSDFSTIPVVSQKIKEVYENELGGFVEEILLGDEEQHGKYLKSLAGYDAEIYASQRMNYKIWDFNQTALTIPYGSYEESVMYFKDFVEQRNDWLCEAVGRWTGCGEVQKAELVIPQPLAGMPLESQVKLLDKWCGGKIISAGFIEQDTYFEPDKDYHYRVVFANQLGSSLTENLSLTANLGEVESLFMPEDGKMEAVINVGRPKKTNTVYQGVDYAPVYDKDYYLEHYPKVAEQTGTSDEAVLKYFVTEGMEQQHQGCEDFDVKVYMARYGMFWEWEYPDVYMHYLTEGISQGWSGKL